MQELYEENCKRLLMVIKDYMKMERHSMFLDRKTEHH